MKVTCIMPIGPDNHRYLHEAIGSASIAKDNGVYDEVIMCVTASAQSHPAIKAGLDYGFQLIVTYDASIGRQKNLAIAQATGDYICCLDADDVLNQVGQACMRTEITSHEYRDVHYGQVREFGLNYDLIWPENPSIELLGSHNCVPVCAWHSKELWWMIGGYQHVRYEDWHFWKRAKSADALFQFHPFLFYHHRRHWESIGGKTNWNSSLGHDL